MNLQEITQYVDLFTVLLNAQEESSLFVSDTNTFIYSNDKYGLGIRVGDRIKKDSVTQLVIEQNQMISKAVDRVGSSYAKEYFATGVPLRDNTGALIGAITWVSHNHKATLEKMGRELALLSREILDASHMFATTTETLAQKNHDAYSSIVELDTNIKHIQKMNRVISDIANQTHMLGLNAAIESARAGEAGRGFSVVASEVQKLATQSKNSAKEITQLIGQTSSSMMHAMEVIQENNNESNQQAAYAKELDSMVQRLESLAKQLDQNSDKDVVMTWNDSFSVHDNVIDSQHKGLLNLINDLYSAMKHNRSKDVLGKVISQLIDYTAKHFTYEEQHMKRIGYPELPGHTKQHQKFVAEVLEFQKAFQEGKTTVSYEIIEFLKDWLMNHILVSDKKYDSTVFHV